MPIVARRLLQLVPVLLAVSALTFLMINLLPGDPVDAILGTDAPEEQREVVRADLGLDRPLPQRYADWLGGVVQGDLGRSYRTNQPVWDMLASRLPVSLELMVLAQLLALSVAIPLGVLTAYRRDSVLDRTASGTSYALLAAPPFVMAVLLIYIVAVRLQWLPATGYVRLTDDPWDNLRSLALPAIVLALGPMAVNMRLLRSDMIGTLQEDFILMARAEGLTPRRILFGHALRPSLLPLLTVVGINVGALIGGAVIIEQLFALPGIGSLVVDAIFNRDYLVLQGAVLLIAVAYVMVNLVVDLLYTTLDPRIRHGSR